MHNEKSTKEFEYPHIIIGTQDTIDPTPELLEIIKTRLCDRIMCDKKGD